MFSIWFTFDKPYSSQQRFVTPIWTHVWLVQDWTFHCLKISLTISFVFIKKNDGSFQVCFNYALLFFLVFETFLFLHASFVINSIVQNVKSANHDQSSLFKALLQQLFCWFMSTFQNHLYIFYVFRFEFESAISIWKSFLFGERSYPFQTLEVINHSPP